MRLEAFQNEPIESFSKAETLEQMATALATVRSQFGQDYPIVINGKRISTKESIVSTNPSNPAEIVGSTAKADIAHADSAIEAAWKAFASWKEWKQEDRSAVLLKAAAIMRGRKRELEAWLVYEIGKNFIEASAEVAEMIDFIEYYARQAMTHTGSIGMLNPWPGESNESFYIPLGVGVIISPWNFPMALMTGMTSAAILVGNTVVCKPAEDTVVSLAKIFDIFEEAGLPAGVVNYLPGIGREVGPHLVSHPKTRFVNFTGSKVTGLGINELAAKVGPGQKWIKRVFLELGGKDVILVDETADLDAAALGVIQSSFGYSGQKCSACSRLVVVESVYNELMDRIITQTEDLVVDEAYKNPNLGPLCNKVQEDKVLSYLEIAKSEGKLLIGGDKADAPGFLINPTIFGNVDQNARIAQEEIFGPVLSVIPVTSFEEGINAVNNTEYGLSGAIFSGQPERLHIARRDFHVGNLYFNRKCTGALAGVQPFGGFNLSGTDTKTGGPDYLLQFLQMKTVAERL